VGALILSILCGQPEFGQLRAAIGVKDRVRAALDTSGIPEKWRLYFPFADMKIADQRSDWRVCMFENPTIAPKATVALMLLACILAMCFLASAAMGADESPCAGPAELEQLGSVSGPERSAREFPDIVEDADDDVPDIVQITTGTWHGCGRYQDGRVACWGSYTIGHTPESGGRSPFLVPGLTAVDDLASGGVHVCALSAGMVYCWGNNVFGQLGQGTRDEDGALEFVAEPQQVPGLNQIVQIEAGQFHTCARDIDGSVYCWGKNENKQADYSNVNPGANPFALLPVQAADIEPAIDLVAGQRTNCAMHNDQTLSCWGFAAWWPANWEINFPGFVGAAYDQFVAQSPLGDAVCAHTSATEVNCKGIHFDVGSDWLDYGLPPGSSVPAIGGHEGSLCTRQGSTIWCGRSADGGGNNGDCDDGAIPMGGLCPILSVDLVAPVDQLSIGGKASLTDQVLMCALLDSRQVYCWGPNNRGQVGDGTDIDRDVPVRLHFPGGPLFADGFESAIVFR